MAIDLIAKERFTTAARRMHRCQSPFCDGQRRQSQSHHVIYEQHVRRYDPGAIWDPDNALRLCEPCHAAHHNRSRVLPVSALRDCNIEFGINLMGLDRAINYFQRYYRDDDDARLRRRQAA